MSRLWAVVIGLCLLAPALPARAVGPEFPKPDALVPRVDFWKRIYSEVGTDGGLIHDARDVAVVYEIVRLPIGTPRSARDRKIRRRKNHYEGILRHLGAGHREGLDAEHQRVLALFPPGVSNKTLRAAAGQVRFQLGQADKFRDGMVRKGRWEDYIRRVFVERGLPEELGLLPHVESSFNPEAHSHAGAAGLWQFTRSTGRMFMRVDHVIDERRDPFLATVAAARLLKANYEKTGTWPLAITAYNHGAGGMNRAVRQLGTRDIATILDRHRSRTFGFASRNFYCEFLAAVEVDREGATHFGPLRPDPPDDPEIAVLDHYYKASTLASAFGLDPGVLRRVNPALLQPIWSGQKYVPRGYGLRLPRDGRRESAKVVLAAVPAGQRFTKQVPDRNYRVKHGDTLSQIARRFGVSQSQLAALNGLRSRHRIRVGQVLKLPSTGAPTAVAAVARPDLAPEPVPADGLYRVRRGDNLQSIARRFAVSESDLVALNALRNRNVIRVGQVLQIPRGAATARPSASGGSGVYVVRRGDTLHQISRRFGTTPAAIAERNGLRGSLIRPGQRLYIPGDDPEPPTPAPSAAAEEQSRVTREAPPAVAAPPPAGPQAPPSLPLSPHRYRVAEDGSIRIQPGETLGGVADWLRVPVAELRRRNGLVRGQPLPLGGRLVLDWSRTTPAEFEGRRLEHHRRVQSDFYGSYAVAGTLEVVLRRGDTLWKIAEGHGAIPVWLLLEYNPGVESTELRAGQRVRVPRLERRSS